MRLAVKAELQCPLTNIKAEYNVYLQMRLTVKAELSRPFTNVTD